MDKYIRYKDEFLNSAGFPVAILDPDPAKQREARQTAIASGKVEGLKSNEIQWTAPMIEEPTFSDIICSFAEAIPHGEEPAEGEPPLRATSLDHENSAHTQRAFQTHEDSYVKIEETALVWIRKQMEDHGQLTFRGTVPYLLLERLKDELTSREIVDIETSEKLL